MLSLYFAIYDSQVLNTKKKFTILPNLIALNTQILTTWPDWNSNVTTKVKFLTSEQDLIYYKAILI